MQKSDFRVGIVGIGLMGANMARRLHDQGYPLTALFDMDHTKTTALAEELGCEAVTTPADVAKDSNTVLTVVSDDQGMRDIFKPRSPQSLLAHAADCLFINCATVYIDPRGLYGMWPFGNPLGGEMEGPVPVPPVNISLGLGGTIVAGLGVVNTDSGFAVDTHGNFCYYYTKCAGFGMNIPGSGKVGMTTSLGTGNLCSGEQTSNGVYWMGGSGFAAEGQILIRDEGGTSTTKGFFGIGETVGAGILSCESNFKCLK